MSVQIKVLPVAADAVGMVHPHGGPLAAEGSLWTHDTFTERLLQEQVIRRFEAGVDGADEAEAADAGSADADAAAKTAGKAKSQAIA